MEVLRHIERVEVVGLDEAYLDLTGLDRHRSAARRVEEAVKARPGSPAASGSARTSWWRRWPPDAEKPDGFLELTAEGARIRFAEASPASCPASAQDGRAPRAARDRHAGPPRRHAGRAAHPVVRAAARPHLAALCALRGRPHHRDGPDREVRVARDHLRPRPAASPSSSRSSSGSPASSARRSRARRRGRTIGIKVRFDDFSTVTRARLDAAGERHQTVGTVALELLRRLDPRRPVRLLGVRVAGLDEGLAGHGGRSAQPLALT